MRACITPNKEAATALRHGFCARARPSSYAPPVAEIEPGQEEDFSLNAVTIPEDEIRALRDLWRHADQVDWVAYERLRSRVVTLELPESDIAEPVDSALG